MFKGPDVRWRCCFQKYKTLVKQSDMNITSLFLNRKSARSLVMFRACVSVHTRPPPGSKMKDITFINLALSGTEVNSKYGCVAAQPSHE